jgi:serine/threonine protein kinase
LSALEYVHGKGIVHTDVKSDNILLSYRDGNAKATLIDFGSAVYLAGRRQANIGTPGYIAPEALLQADWNAAVDIWGAGCVVAEIAAGKTLFPTSGKCDLYLYCMQTAMEAPIPPTLLRSAGKFPDPSNPARPPIVDASGMIPFPASGTGKFCPAPLSSTIQSVQVLPLLRQLLALDPTVRATPSQALAKLSGQSSSSIPSSKNAVKVVKTVYPETTSENYPTALVAACNEGPSEPALVEVPANADWRQQAEIVQQNPTEIEGIAGVGSTVYSGTGVLAAATTYPPGQLTQSDDVTTSAHVEDLQHITEDSQFSSADTSTRSSSAEHKTMPHIQLKDALSPEIEFDVCRPAGPASPESSAKNSSAKKNCPLSDRLEQNIPPVRIATMVEPAGPSRTSTTEWRHIPEGGLGWTLPGDQGLPRSGSADPWIMMPSIGPGHIGSTSFTVGYTAGFTAGAVWSPYGPPQSATWAPITNAPVHFGGWQQ